MPATRVRRFTAALKAGHKQMAVEVPFDPAQAWSIAATSLSPGRRGYRVRGSANGIALRSAVVARSRRFWLLFDENLVAAGDFAEGDPIDIAIEPDGTGPA